MKIIPNYDLPSIMKAVQLVEFDQPLQLIETAVPTPGKGEVLVKMDSAPVNPSDWSYLKGIYSAPKKPPVIPGFEGSGTVVASGSDFMSKRLLGKKVSCFAPPAGNGTWAQFMVTSNKTVIPLRKEVDLEQGSMLLINPLSVFAMVEIAKKRKIKGIANTAAASALGQMLDKLCSQSGITCINIVRRQEQVDQLKAKGIMHVINSTDENYQAELKEAFKQYNVMLAFDPIAGDSPYSLLEALPKGGEVMVYGSLSLENVTAHPRHLVFSDKKLSGFWLSAWIPQQNILKLLRLFDKVQKFLNTSHVHIQQRVSLENAQDGINQYIEKMSAGKVLIKPWE
ncbi:MAG: zinc-binding dehydrogenase [Cyclobacteriaceae bacterium]